ncbi:MAG: hypothetical protein JSR80_07025 [Verrucomicrobia bacterium]|nr:hypothetical protein [Verrucomicrobiota bacterium]
MMRWIFLPFLIFSLPLTATQPIARTASVHFEMMHRANPEEKEALIGEGVIEVEATIEWEGERQLRVALKKIKVQNCTQGDLREFDTSEEAFWPIRWWRLRQLRRAMGAPLHYSLSDEGKVTLVDGDLEERFGAWPYCHRFIVDTLGQVLFCREFALRERRLEKEMLIIEPIYSDAKAPLAQFTVEEAGADRVRVVYSSEWAGEGHEGHFSGYMEWSPQEPLLYQHEGTDLYSIRKGQGETKTHMKREIHSRFLADS